jgi:glycosyltransferase involved in cell wall biosynthesis
MVGRNNEKTIPATYNSIRRQNYTNYRIVHIDDHSTDFTVKALAMYLQ